MVRVASLSSNQVTHGGSAVSTRLPGQSTELTMPDASAGGLGRFNSPVVSRLMSHTRRCLGRLLLRQWFSCLKLN